MLIVYIVHFKGSFTNGVYLFQNFMISKTKLSKWHIFQEIISTPPSQKSCTLIVNDFYIGIVYITSVVPFLLSGWMLLSDVFKYTWNFKSIRFLYAVPNKTRLIFFTYFMHNFAWSWYKRSAIFLKLMVINSLIEIR